MLSSRFKFKIAFAIVVAVCCTTVGSFYEIVWSGSIASHIKPLFDACTTHTAATDGELSRERFAKIVSNLSEQSIHGPFERLPLKYKSLFNSHACMNGRNCIGDFAAIAVSTNEGRRLICASLASLLSQSMSWNMTSSGNKIDASNRHGSMPEPICTMDSGGAMTCVSK